jgi:hypothetical protein
MATMTTRDEHRNAADGLRRAAEQQTGIARARLLDRAGDHYHAAGLSGFAGWCERHADRCRND